MTLIEQLKQKLRMLTTQPTPLDPSHFRDPVALKTEWTPARRGGSSFRTHKLLTIRPNRIEFRASTGAVLFYLLFFLLGMGMLTGLSISLYSTGIFSIDPALAIPLLISLIFTVIGAYMLHAGTVPLVFEKGRGVFWKGRKGPDEAMDNRSSDRFVRLDSVHALQLISEYISGSKSSYYSYELNLVLEDGKRVTVIDHGNRNKIREDGRALAVFLGKPFWDTTGDL